MSGEGKHALQTWQPTPHVCPRASTRRAMQVPTAPLPAMPGAIGLGGTPASARLLQEPQTPATDAGPLKPMCRTGSTAQRALLRDPLR